MCVEVFLIAVVFGFSYPANSFLLLMEQTMEQCFIFVLPANEKQELLHES